jgi:hypothetical protein
LLTKKIIHFRYGEFLSLIFNSIFGYKNAIPLFTVPSCSIPNCQANCSSLIHSFDCRKCSNNHQLLEVDCGQRKGEEERRKWQPEEPKKKRSWAATFVKNKKGRKATAFEGDDDGEAEANAIARFGSCGSKKPLGPSLSWDPQQQQWRQQRSK